MTLLDVNVVLALGWPNHQHHGRARRWFLQTARHGWATCAVTELGFIRLSANPAFTSQWKAPADAAALLGQLCAVSKHSYLPDPVAPRELVTWQAVSGAKQTTDAYLLALASHHGVAFATFDARLRSLGGDVLIVPE